MPDWRDLADCQYTDPDVFFDPSTVSLAKSVCAGCTVVDECLSAAMRDETPGEEDTPEANLYDRHGIRGGLDGDERWRLHYKERATL